MLQIFPLGIALGGAFCNREHERKLLKNNIKNGRHTWLMAPRRYGKTSLILQTCSELGHEKKKVYSQSIDLLLVHDMDSVFQHLSKLVSHLMRESVPGQQRLLEAINSYFNSLRPELRVTSHGMELMLSPDKKEPESLVDMLLSLDRFAADKKLRFVVILDEFQQLASLKNHLAIEAAFRHAVERASHITYLFAGSYQHLLRQMFEDPKRPLYHLCEKMELARIQQQDYIPFLDDAARLNWGKILSPDAIERIMRITQRHPYYVNMLCGRLWQDKKLPTPQEIDSAWNAYLQAETHRLAQQLVGLSPNQRALLKALANDPVAQPRSREYLMKTRLASASAGQALQVLLEKDLIYRPDELYRVLDPALEQFIRDR
ncbi:MAG: ATP-binding protein [Gammaproteobacteria bacterium]|nr:ATP-binding protein [Gammaproteobacteria bacterium]NNC97351.1 ATP-binding protein [Gammaproteobacteria bacterium]NNM13130.1 ATP-binding protein [Gammaproteobacteria bacterium]